MTVVTLPIHTAVIDGSTVRYMDRMKKDRLGAVVDRVVSTSKGCADTFGVGANACKVLGEFLPGTSDWTRHASGVMGQARGALSIAYLPAIANRCFESFESKKYYDGIRNGLEVGSVSCFASSLLALSGPVTEVLKKAGPTFKLFVDGMDLGKNVDKYFHFKNLLSEAKKNTGVPKEVIQGMKAEKNTAILKIARFVLVVFGGLLAVLANVFKVAIAKELLLVGVIAVLGSLIFSFAAEFNNEAGKVVPVPPGMWKLHQRNLHNN